MTDFHYPIKDNHYRIIDGDTVEVALDLGFGIVKTVKLRILGIDTPEKRTRNQLEKQAGYLVTRCAEVWFNHWDMSEVQLYATSEEKPKYAGRIVGRLMCSESDQELGAWMRTTGFARTYYGGKKKAWSNVALKRIIKTAKELLGD